MSDNVIMKDDKNVSKDVYQRFLNDVVTMVQNYRAVAVQSVQAINNQLYWNIGELILKMQREHGWGKSIVEKLSNDLQHQIGEGVSWSPRNLWFMRQLVTEYSNLNQLGSERENNNNLNLKQLVSEVPWMQNILILQKVKDINARIFYLQSAVKPSDKSKRKNDGFYSVLSGKSIISKTYYNQIN